MPRRDYSTETKDLALKLYVSDGANYAARSLGIPEATVASWARRARLARREGTVPATEGSDVDALHAGDDEAERMSWPERRRDEREKLASLVTLARERLHAALQRNDAQRAAVFSRVLERTIDSVEMLHRLEPATPGYVGKDEMQLTREVIASLESEVQARRQARAERVIAGSDGGAAA